MPTVQVADSFYHQTLGVFGATGGSPTFTTATLRGSDPASLSIPAATVATFARYDLNALNNFIGWQAFAFNVQTLPTGSQLADFANLSVASGAVTAFLRLSGSGTSFTITPRLSVDGTASSGLTTATWYWLEMLLDSSGTTFSLQYRVGPIGGTIADQPGMTLAAQTSSRTQNYSLGCTSNVTTGPAILYSSFIGGLAASTTNWLGETIARAYSPNAVGTHNLDAATSTYFFKEVSAVDTALTTSETTSYQTIDDVPLSQDIDAIFVAPVTGAPNTPALRAWGTPTFSGNSVANGSLTPGTPTGKASGDGLILIAASSSNAFTVTTPTGWTLLTTTPPASGTAVGGKVYVFGRIADGSATDVPAVTFAGLSTGTTGTPGVVVLGAYTNLDPTTLDASVASSDLAAQTTTSVIPAQTTATDKSLVIGIGLKMLESSGQTSTVATFTERVDSSTTSGTGFALEVSDLVKTPAGSSGTATITWSATTSARAFTVSLALKASVAVTQPTNTWYAEYQIADEATLTSVPTAVRAIVARALDTAVASTFVAKLFDSVQGTNTEDVYNASISTVAKAYQWKIFPQRPNTGGAWTVAALNGLRLRFGLTAAATGHPRLEGAMVEAFYPAAAPPAGLTDSGTVAVTFAPAGAAEIIDSVATVGAAETIVQGANVDSVATVGAAELVADAAAVTAAATPSGAQAILTIDAGTAAVAASVSGAEALADATGPTATGGPAGVENLADATPVAVAVAGSGGEATRDAAPALVSASLSAAETLADGTVAPVAAAASGAETASDATIVPVAVSPSAVELLADGAPVTVAAAPTGSEGWVGAAAAAVTVAPSAAETLADAGAVTAGATPAAAETVLDSGLAPATVSPAAAELVAETGPGAATGTPAAAELLADAGNAAATATPSGAGLVATFAAGTVPVAASPTGAELLAETAADSITVTPAGTQTGSANDAGTAAASTSPAGAEALADATAATAATTPSATEALLDAGAIPATVSPAAAEALVEIAAAALVALPSGTPATTDSSALATVVGVAAAETLADAVSAALSALLAGGETVADLGPVPAAVSTLVAGETLTDGGVAGILAVPTGSALLLITDAGTVSVLVLPVGASELFSVLPPGTAVALVTLLPTMTAGATVLPTGYAAAAAIVDVDADLLVAARPTADASASSPLEGSVTRRA